MRQQQCEANSSCSHIGSNHVLNDSIQWPGAKVQGDSSYDEHSYEQWKRVNGECQQHQRCTNQKAEYGCNHTAFRSTPLQKISQPAANYCPRQTTDYQHNAGY